MDEDTRSPWFLIPFLFTIAVIGIVDVALDSYDSLWSLHLFVDLSLIAVSLVTVVYLGLGWLRAGRSLAATRTALERRADERDRWQHRTEDLLRGLGAVMDEVFDEWDLTRAERETALLLLKGHSHKRIAQLTDRSAATARQHAVAVYRKSGLAGRATLSAFFLEQLVLPEGAGNGAPAPEDSMERAPARPRAPSSRTRRRRKGSTPRQS